MLLVTGITGLTGRFLYRELMQGKEALRVKFLIRKTSDISWMGSGAHHLCYGDVTSVEDLVRCMDGVRAVIHLVNIRHSPQIIDACRQSGVDRVIFINTTGMYSNYQVYANLYHELEKGIKSSSLKYTIIRPTMIYGNHLDKNIHKLVRLVKKYPAIPVVGDGSSLMQPIYAGDLAKAIYLAFTNNKSIKQEYNVAGSEPISYLNLLKIIANALGKKTFFFHVPFSLALVAGRVGDIIPNGLIDLEKVKRLSEDKVFDYSLVERELGFNPLPFSEGIKLEVKSLKEFGLI